MSSNGSRLVELRVDANGVIAAPGLIVTDFGAYARPPGVGVWIEALYYSGVASSDVAIFLAPSGGAAPPTEDTIDVARSNPVTQNLARFCLWVPSVDPVTRVPMELRITKGVATNARVRVLYRDREYP